MKRVSGHVTWEVRFAQRFLEGVRSGAKRQTVRRCWHVEAGDALRLAGPGGETLWEVGVVEVRDLWIVARDNGGCLGVVARSRGEALDAKAVDAIAVADGFSGGQEMIRWMIDNDQFLHGVFDGQVIRW